MYCCKVKSEFRKPDLQPALTTFLDPCPIKDTNINAFSLDGKGISNIDNIINETGKVTAVVAVMQVNSNPTKESPLYDNTTPPTPPERPDKNPLVSDSESDDDLPIKR